MLAALLAALLLAELGDHLQLASRFARVWSLLPTMIAALSLLSLIVLPPSDHRRYNDAAFAGVQFVADELPGGAAFDVFSDVAELSLLGQVEEVMPLAALSGCPSGPDVVVLDFSPPSSGRFRIDAVLAGEDSDVYEARELEEVRQSALAAVQIDGELEQCGFRPAFSEDDVSVYIHP